MYASKRNSTSTLDVSQLDAVSQLCLTVSRRHSDAELIDSPTDDEQSSPATPINSEAPYHMSVAAHSSSDVSSLHTKVQPSSASQTSDSKSKRVFTFPTVSCSTTEKLVRASTLISDSSHSKLCRYFCSEENSSLCPSKQQTTTSNIETPISPVRKNKPFKRSLFPSKKGRPVSAIFATQKFTDDTFQQTVSHARSQSGGDSSSFTEPTPSLDRSSSTSSTLSSHESFQSDRIVNTVNATDELSPVTDVDSGSKTITTWSSERSSFNTNVHNSAPVSAASSPRLSPIESHRKGIFSKRANTQPAMTIDITSSPKPSKGLKAAIRNKRETAVLKREAKAIQVWRSSTLTLLYSGPDKPTAQEWTKPPEKVEKDALMRRFIIYEIYTTEKSYLRNLLIMKTKFMDPMIESAKLGSPLVRPQDLPILFAHLADTIKISTQIIGIFEHYKETSGILWRQCPLRVGRIFMNLNDDMACYVKYALDYHSLEKVLKRAVRNEEYRKFNQDSINNVETNRMGLADYLIMPIQRVTRYGLLLKDLKKHTAVTNPDYNDLDGAIKMITALALAMNHAQKRN